MFILRSLIKVKNESMIVGFVRKKNDQQQGDCESALCN